MTPTRAPQSNGMPMLGLGTWQNTDPEQCAESVQTALEMGYRHVDTAQAYRNEEYVGDGIAAADVDREDVFVATKVWENNFDYSEVITSANRSRDRLQVETIDLLYVHWPRGAYDADETLLAFDQLVDDGVARRIGVSNFTVDLLKEAEAKVSHGIFANQVEMHPLLPQRDLRRYCERHDIELVAYSPLARGEVFDVPQVQAVAEKHGVSEAQVSLAWLREKGVTAIPKATGEDHIAQNWASLDLELDDEDVERIDDVDVRHRCVDPDDAPWNR